MITHIKNHSYLSPVLRSWNIFFILLAMMSFVACQSDIVTYNDGYVPGEDIPNTGAPEITAIYDVADIDYSHPLTDGKPGQTVCVVGKNLNKVIRITFNTLEADLTNVYTQGTRAIVTIPSEVTMGGDNALIYTTEQEIGRAHV